MFHTYVATRSGKSVDIDRASFLMNKQLFQQALNTSQWTAAVNYPPESAHRSRRSFVPS